MRYEASAWASNSYPQRHTITMQSISSTSSSLFLPPLHPILLFLSRSPSFVAAEYRTHPRQRSVTGPKDRAKRSAA